MRLNNDIGVLQQEHRPGVLSTGGGRRRSSATAPSAKTATIGIK